MSFGTFLFLCTSFAASQLAKYAFSAASGQIVLDSSGNDFHGINGSSLFPGEEDDVVWTDRGAHFDNFQALTLPTNDIASESPLNSFRLTFIFWTYSEHRFGSIFHKPGRLTMFFDGSGFCVEYFSAEYCLETDEILGKGYTDQWAMLTLSIRPTTMGQELVLGINNEADLLIIDSQHWVDDPASAITVGSADNGYDKFRGFLYSFEIHEEVYTNFFDFLFSNEACVYPADLSGCLSSCSDETANSACAECDCGENSCSSDMTCIVCPAECPDYCENAQCIEVPELCAPFGFDETNRACLWDCPQYCAKCTDSGECTTCVDGYTVGSQGLCEVSCSSGYFLNSETSTCTQCPDTCTECSSLSQCTECEDPNATVADGACQCSAGFYTDSECKPCTNWCAECSGPSLEDCTQCTGEAMVTTEAGCACEQGYYLDTPLSECVSCPQGCLACLSSLVCTSCIDPGAILSEGQCIVCPVLCELCSSEECFGCVADAELTNGTCECIEDHSEFEGGCLPEFEVKAELSEARTVHIHFDNPVELSTTDITISPEEVCSVTFNVSTEDKHEYSVALTLHPDTLVEPLSLTLELGLSVDANGTALLSTNTLEIVLEPLLDTSTIEETENDTEEEEELEEDQAYTAEESLGTSTVTSAAVVGIFAVTTLEDPSVLWTILSISQFISYLPLLNLNISQELYHFLQSFQTAYFLPNVFAAWVAPAESQAPRVFNQYGKKKQEYEDTNSLRNSWRFLTVFSVMMLPYLLARPVARVLPCQVLQQKLRKLSCQWMVGAQRVWLQLLLDFFIAVLVDVATTSKESSVYSLIFAYCLLSLMLVTPVVSFYATYRWHDRLICEDPSLLDKLGPYFAEIRMTSRASLVYHGLLNTRRLLFGCFLYTLPDYPGANFTLHLLLSVGFISYLLSVKPLKSTANQFVYLLGEAVLAFNLVMLSWAAFSDSGRSLAVTVSLIVADCGFVVVGSLILVISLVHQYRKARAESKVACEMKELPKKAFSQCEPPLGTEEVQGCDTNNGGPLQVLEIQELSVQQ